MIWNRKTAIATAAVVGLGTLTFGGLSVEKAQAQGPKPLQSRPMLRERHPELRRALRNLEQTERNLRNADRDFGGHRAKAADLCHQAELQVQQAIRYDR